MFLDRGSQFKIEEEPGVNSSPEPGRVFWIPRSRDDDTTLARTPLSIFTKNTHDGEHGDQLAYY